MFHMKHHPTSFSPSDFKEKKKNKHASPETSQNLLLHRFILKRINKVVSRETSPNNKKQIEKANKKTTSAQIRTKKCFT